MRGPQLSVKNFELGGAVAFGITFILAVALAIGTWSHFAGKRQAATFSIALTALAGEPNLAPVVQREARLLKTADLYHWRALLWRETDSGKTPLIWSVKVRATDPMIIESSELLPYTPFRARELELPALPARTGNPG